MSKKIRKNADTTEDAQKLEKCRNEAAAQLKDALDYFEQSRLSVAYSLSEAIRYRDDPFIQDEPGLWHAIDIQLRELGMPQTNVPLSHFLLDAVF